MEGKRLIQTLRMQNILSYGDQSHEIGLEPLNVIIGPNAAGKSNLIEIIGLLGATPKDLIAPIRKGGGISEWLWKGAKSTPIADIEATIFYREGFVPLRYRLQFTMVGQRLEIVDEVVEDEHRRNFAEADVFFYYRYQHGRPVLSIRTTTEDSNSTKIGATKRMLRREDLSLDQSVLSQRKDPDLYPEITYLGEQFSNIRFYREWNLGRDTAPRRPQLP